MDKQKITSLINRSNKVDVITISSLATSQKIDEQLRLIKESMKKNLGKEIILIQVLGNT